MMQNCNLYVLSKQMPYCITSPHLTSSLHAHNQAIVPLFTARRTTHLPSCCDALRSATAKLHVASLPLYQPDPHHWDFPLFADLLSVISAARPEIFATAKLAGKKGQVLETKNSSLQSLKATEYFTVHIALPIGHHSVLGSPVNTSASVLPSMQLAAVGWRLGARHQPQFVEFP